MNEKSTVTTKFMAECMFSFYGISKMAARIIEFLYRNNGFDGGFSAICAAFELTTGPNGQTPNIRNTCLRLEQAEIITITWEKERVVSRIELTPNWYFNLRSHEDIIAKTLSQQSRLAIVSPNSQGGGKREGGKT